MRSFRWLLLPLPFVLGVGCGTQLEYLPLNPPPRSLAARDPASVGVFVSQMPSAPYVEVGLLQAQQESPESVDQPAEMLGRMREAAASEGCDAIILSGDADATRIDPLMTVLQKQPQAGPVRGLLAVCIVYQGAQAAEAPSTQPAWAAAPLVTTPVPPAPIGSPQARAIQDERIREMQQAGGPAASDSQ